MEDDDTDDDRSEEDQPEDDHLGSVQSGSTNDSPDEAPNYAKELDAEERRARRTRMIMLGLIVVVIAIIGVVVYTTMYSQGGHTPTKVVKNGSSNSTTVTTMTSISTTSVITVAQEINISNLNVLYTYSGPSTTMVGNQTVSCGLATHATTMSGFRATGGSQITYLIPFSTSYCAVTIKTIKATTDGFSVVTVNPKLPYNIPAHSNGEVAVVIQLPPKFTYGPISLTVEESG